MTNKIKQYQLRLFNRLFSTLPNVKKLNNDTNDLNLDEAITHIYYFHNKKFWFTEGEKNNKYIFIFGLKNKPIHTITTQDKSLVIDFDKTKQFNDDSLGLFSIQNSEIHILINQDILNKKYPYINTSDFKKRTLKSANNKLKLNTIDLGSLNEDFIENIEKLIIDSSKKEKIIAVPTYEPNKKENDDCSICGNNISKTSFNSKIKSLKNKKPELCGKCIEKIITAEFYDKVTPLIKSNDSKELNNVREKMGNDQLFDLGMELLEKYDIIKYIGVKKLFFTIDKSSLIVKEYGKFSDKNNLLIDNLFQAKKTTPKPTSSKKENKTQNNFINEKTTTLTKETITKMNLFLNALKAGKTYDAACKIANLNSKKIEHWYKLGKKGDKNYIAFYNEYQPFRPENIERNEKMDKFLEALTNDNFENALKKSGLKASKVRSWYNLGEKGDEDYKNFYFGCKLLMPEGIPKEDTGKIVNNEELMNEFITLIEDGKTNDEAISQLKIPKFKVKNWFNQGKLGNKKYVDFYNAYMIEINRNKQTKKAKKLKKSNEQKKTKIQSGEKICRICGRKYSKKRTKDICKRCEKKQYASKIILKLLKVIQPEIPFKKEDLRSLNLEEFQIKDYIWTLKEFNLITEKNNKYQLKNKEFLEEFIKKSGIKIDELPNTENEDSLHKTCKKCGKTLLKTSNFFKSDSSEDGYEDNCKDCKKLISAADYLKEINEYVNYRDEFSEDDLKPYFKDSFKLQAKLWSLIENDLVRKNFEENTYILTDEKTADAFLEKYLEEKPKIQTLIKYTKEEQMKIIIKAISEGKTRSEAAELAGIPLYKITHWFNEGRQGYGNDNIEFYKKLKEIEMPQNALKLDMKFVLHEVMEGKDISQISHVSENEIKNWISKGKQNIKPYYDFYVEYQKIIQVNNEDDLEEYNNKEINRKIFLENIKIGKTKQEAAENADIDLSLVEKWYSKGFANEIPYKEFYEKYVQLKNKPKKAEIPQIEKIDQFGNGTTITQMNLILKNMADGMDEDEAIKNSGISENTYKYWLNRGKQEFGEIYTQFYYYINEIKDGKFDIADENNLSDNIDSDIYAPLPEKYEILFKSGKQSQTGIAWVNKVGKQWIYTNNNDGEPIRLTNENIYELHKNVKNKKYPWGIRDYEKAKNIIDIPEEFIAQKPKNKEFNDINIDFAFYAPLPEKYEKSFKSQKTNKTGIAWVNKMGHRWIYAKYKNSNLIELKDENLYKLFEKVKNENLIWGIRDYEKASKIIDFPDYLELPKIKERNKKTVCILKPLPEKYYAELDLNATNNSGFAWVNKIDSNWIYEKQNRLNTCKFSDNDLYKLYTVVNNNHHVWGVINLEQAKKSLKHNDEHDVNNENIFNIDKTPNFDDYGIYAPLPKKYEDSFKSSPMNKSGIAWVNNPGTGKKWIYEKRINGKLVSFIDSDIYELYKKVKKANHVWGIRDYSRAKKIIDIPDDFIIPETNETDEEPQSPINPEIYSPLPQKYLETFPKQSNQTGIAWVNKVGNQFIYSRKVNGKTVKITNYDIYELYEEVIAQNQIWGIRNYDNARKFIDIPDDFEIPKTYKKPDEKEQINTDIYAPLSKENISKFNPNMNNKSGIAWVNKVGNKWFYQRQRNGKTIRIGDANIRKLHEKVLKNKQIWGIIDIEKARISIENNGELPSNKTITHITSKNVTITYIEKQDKTDIIIKGIIKNNELINLLNKLKVFEENIKRIITTSINKEVDLFIEIEVNNDLLERFEEKISDLNWKINK